MGSQGTREAHRSLPNSSSSSTAAGRGVGPRTAHCLPGLHQHLPGLAVGMERWEREEKEAQSTVRKTGKKAAKESCGRKFDKHRT